MIYNHAIHSYQEYIMDRNFDLNLLKTLDALLQEKSVTKAAERLFVTQSAVSKNLNKLREAFADPIFIRNGKALFPTPRALELAKQIKPIMQGIDKMTVSDSFEPSKCNRRFKFDMMEVAYAITLPEFMPTLLELAPNVKLETTTWTQDTIQRLNNCEIDFAIKCMEMDTRSINHISSLPTGLNFAELSRDYAVCVVRKGHPITENNLTIDAYLAQNHIQVTGGGNRHWLVDEILVQQGLERNIVLEVPDFHSAFKLCENTDLVLFAPFKQVESIVKHYQLEVVDIPVTMQKGIYVIIWNKYFDHDPAHQWMRDLVIAKAK